MKNICRDFTLVIEVPDAVEPGDCEIVIDNATASYKSGDTYVSVPDGGVEILPEENYECPSDEV